MYTGTQTHTRSYASIQEGDRPYFSRQNSGQKAIEPTKAGFDSSFRIGMAQERRMLYAFRPTMRICTAQPAGGSLSDSSWLDKSARLSAPPCTYAR